VNAGNLGRAKQHELFGGSKVSYLFGQRQGEQADSTSLLGGECRKRREKNPKTHRMPAWVDREGEGETFSQLLPKEEGEGNPIELQGSTRRSGGEKSRILGTLSRGQRKYEKQSSRSKLKKKTKKILPEGV